MSSRAKLFEGAEIEISTAGVALHGELSVPEGASGLVLFAHGSGSSRHSPRNQYVAQSLRDAGVGTLLFDLLTPEEEEAEQFTAHLRFNIKLLADRLIHATHWVAAHEELKQLRIGYFGSSTGGGAALVAAGEEGDSIGAVVSRGGRPDLAGESLRHVVSPTLLIVGELDEPVIRLNEEAFDWLACEKELVIVPGATHLFEEPGALDHVARLTARWFQTYLQHY
ncbi:MAG TPA: dienelactone hydrolase family protein [Candidatus Saccharimonadales bacterium]|nr:dienelactone hydrolase family protein [Candidatus Saccharimonadales bacterium]